MRSLSKSGFRLNQLRFASTHPRPTVHREKTFMQIWCSDTGAYPVMGVMAFAGLFSATVMAYFLATHPDSRISKSSRKSLFRGELKGAELD